ncbi:MAG: hypothetical protein KBT27_06550 [Prevotellaceae bacterium]|nr:hypothetical protein [Candidatus Faecinaster equi]
MAEELSDFEKRRRALQTKLEMLIGNNHVYFNAPSRLEYDCIKYKLSSVQTRHADNLPYHYGYYWDLTLIERNKTSDLFKRIIDYFKTCSFGTSYDADNLHHTVLRLYF